MREFILFGASGDLARQKLYPALFSLFKPSDNMRSIGFGRSVISDEAFQEIVKQSVLSGHKHVDNEKLEAFVASWRFVSGGYDTKGIGSLARVLSPGSERFFYLSIPSSYELISGIIDGMAAHQCYDDRSAIALEKPFGFDEQSAEKVNAKLAQHFPESQVYRIDHYLAKDLVQDLLALRFANPIFEPVWNGKYIERISVEIAEDEGIRGRGQYYESSGALRDMIQNHALQLLAFTVMNQPKDLSAASIHREKKAIFDQLSLYDESDDAIKIGQYKGYRDEAHVAKDSLTETFASLTVKVNTPEWKDVPITITSGKKMKHKSTDITVVFRRREHSMWSASGCSLESNVIRINVQPHNDIRLLLNSEFDLEKKCAFPTELRFGFQDNKFLLKEPYENALRDLFNKDQSIFINADEIVSSWRFIDKVLKDIDAKRETLLKIYE